METSPEQALKLAIVGITGLSKDALHIYVGLATLFLGSLCLRKPLHSLFPILIVLTLAVLGEIVDMRADLASLGYWRWGASLHDILNTMFWPFALFSLSRWTTAFVTEK